MDLVPQLAPATGVSVFKEVWEWEEVKDQYGEFVRAMVDREIDQPDIKVNYRASGLSAEIPDLIRKVHAVNPHGAVTVINSDMPVPVPYEVRGAFDVQFVVGESIHASFMPMGFDWRDLRATAEVCETWRIPWDMTEAILDYWSEILYRRDCSGATTKTGPEITYTFIRPEAYEPL